MSLSADSKMEEVLAAFPGAQRVLFQNFHVGGCSSCGFQPTETLGEVLKRAGADVGQAVRMLEESREREKGLQISPKELDAKLKNGGVKLIDLRPAPEHKMANIEGDLPASQELVDEIFDKWAKDTPIVLYCHKGDNSLAAAANLVEQGFTDVKALAGGIDAWSAEIDPLLPRY